MNNSFQSQDFDFSPLQSTTVMLSQADIDWAVQVSQSETDIVQQWQSFLRALGIRGFQQWIEAGAIDLAGHYNPSRASMQGANCQIGEFRLCIVAQGSFTDEVVAIPRETLDVSKNFAHLYVLVEVQEEINQVTVLSGLRRDRLLAHQQNAPLVLNANNTYAVPVSYFDTSPETLLLYLTHLNPEQLAEPARSVAEPTISAIASDERVTSFGDNVIRVSDWFQDQLGRTASRLSWTLLPPILPQETALSFRSPEEEIDDILQEVSTTVVLPATPIRGAFVNSPQMNAPFRLYALTWALLDSGESEWSLLLVLCPSEGNPLPAGIQLQVCDRASILVNQTLAPDSEFNYLYGQVIGSQDEPFFVSVIFPNGTELQYPAFIF